MRSSRSGGDIRAFRFPRQEITALRDIEPAFDRNGVIFRQIDPLPTLSACPLRFDRVRTFAPQRFDVVCQLETCAGAAICFDNRAPSSSSTSQFAAARSDRLSGISLAEGTFLTGRTRSPRPTREDLADLGEFSRVGR